MATNSIKNGNYGTAENARLAAYDHPNYGPNLNKANPSSYSPPEIEDKITNQKAGSWRYPISSSDE